MSDKFAAAVMAIENSARREDVSAYFVEILPVSGAAVSTLGELLGSETYAASDDRAVRLDEMQFDLGEGPCWDALRSARPVAEPDLPGRGLERWPAFARAASVEPISSIFAFPLLVGAVRFGAVDLYSLEPVHLDDVQTDRASLMAAAVSRRVLRDVLDESESSGEDDGNPLSRRVVHQATGVVLAQLDIPPEDAQLMIQGHAFAVNRTVMSVASDIIERRLRFRRRDGLIEVVE